jgi:hypothetical protein
MKKIVWICLLAVLLVSCGKDETLKIFSLNEEKIVEGFETDEGYAYRYLTEYGMDEDVLGLMEVVIYTDASYTPVRVSLNAIGANKLHETMNFNEDGSIYGLVTSSADPEVSYKIVSENVLVEFYESLESYTVVSKKDVKKDQIEIELKSNTSFNVFTAYTFQIQKDKKGLLILE